VDPSDGDLRFDGSFERDSVVQGLNVCQAGRPFRLTRGNIFEVELLYKEWEITDKRVLDQVEGFIRNPPGGGSLAVARLLFSLGRWRGTEDLEDEVRRCLVALLKTTISSSSSMPFCVREEGVGRPSLLAPSSPIAFWFPVVTAIPFSDILPFFF
jgi:hypothetical protein